MLTLLVSPVALVLPTTTRPRAVTRAGTAVASLSEEAVQAKLSARGRGRGRGRGVRRAVPRREPQPAQSEPPAAAELPLVGRESQDVEVWEVPESLRMPGAARVTEHGRHASLDEIFPGSGLAEAWDTSGELRRALRHALRADLFTPPPQWSAKQVQFATELDSACMVSWSQAASGERACDAFSAALAAHGVALGGEAFLHGLGALCGQRPHGSLIDIVPLNRRVQHSWHQDSGISSETVLLGFPPSDGYEGGGVFSSHVKLSHPLRPTQGDTHGAVVEFERFEPPPEPPAEEYVLRPLYTRGREIWISDDTTHLHSTPDRQKRECLWRFM